MKRSSAMLHALLLLVLLLEMLGCGGVGRLQLSAGSPPPTGIVGTLYPGFTVTVAGGESPFVWNATGTLPPGLSFRNGTFSGTPTTAGTYPVAVSVADGSDQTASLQATFLVNNPVDPIITVEVTPSLVVMDHDQKMTFTATVNNDPSDSGVSWQLRSSLGSLTNQTITSVTYNAPDNVPPGDELILLQATSIEDPRIVSSPLIYVMPPPEVLTSSLPDGFVGTRYKTDILTSGYNTDFSITSGTIPPGLNLLWNPNDATIDGLPTGPQQTYNFTATVSDHSDAGPESASANLSIAIGPPAPLTLTTVSPLPPGGINLFYTSSISAFGGVDPYTFTLAPDSAALPAGLNLTTGHSQPEGFHLGQGVISGYPTMLGTTDNIVVQVTDSQTPPATATLPYSLTIGLPTYYVGTQAPGDVWQLAIFHSTPPISFMGFENRGSNGLPGPMDAAISGQLFPLPNGFSYFYYPHVGTFVNNYVVELRDSTAFVIPESVIPLDDVQYYYYRGNVIASAANTCPQFEAAKNFLFIALANMDFVPASNAYGLATLTPAAPNNYDFGFTSFMLDGTPGSSQTYPGLACDSNLQVFAFTNAAGNPSTLAISSSGFMVIDNGTGIPAIGIQQPADYLSSAAILNGSYLGDVFYANNNLIQACFPRPKHWCDYFPESKTDAVGFGPGSDTSISGGECKDIVHDPFSAHGTDHVITLGPQTSPGMFPAGTLTIGSKTLSNFDVVVGQVNGKFVLLGIALDTNASPVQPYVVLLIQQ